LQLFTIFELALRAIFPLPLYSSISHNFNAAKVRRVTLTFFGMIDIELCASKRIPSPTYEVYEHSGGSIPSPPSPDPGPAASPHSGQSWYSCVVSVAGREYETSYVYKAEENAKEKAAKKAYEALNSTT